MFGLSRLATILALSGLAASAVGGGWLYVRHLQREAATARYEAVRAGQGEDLATGTTRAVVQYHTKETVIRETAEPIIEIVKEMPGAESPLPDDLRVGFIAGIHSLRDQAAAPAGDNRAVTPRRELPAP